MAIVDKPWGKAPVDTSPFSKSKNREAEVEYKLVDPPDGGDPPEDETEALLDQLNSEAAAMEEKGELPNRPTDEEIEAMSEEEQATYLGLNESVLKPNDEHPSVPICRYNCLEFKKKHRRWPYKITDELHGQHKKWTTAKRLEKAATKTVKSSGAKPKPGP